jgi:hypothetical protein
MLEPAAAPAFLSGGTTGHQATIAFRSGKYLLSCPAQLQRSINFGKSVADVIYEKSTTDGTLNPNGTPAAYPWHVPLGIFRTQVATGGIPPCGRSWRIVIS